MQVQAVMFDLDDTLLRDDRTISDYTVSTLHQLKDKGIRIIPASGRTSLSMRSFVERIGCADFYISANGADLYSGDHRLINRLAMPVDLMKRILAFCDENELYVQTYDDNRFYFTRKGPFADDYAMKSSLTGIWQPGLTDAIKEPRVKMVAIDTPERIAELYRKAMAIFGNECSITCSKPDYLEFSPFGGTKGNALKRAAGIFGFEVEKTVAFGDSLNDMSMLQTAGRGVAMANARPDVLAVIPFHCGSNQEDGVARYLAPLLEGGELV